MEPEAFGKYTLVALLGVGGMARVYRAVLRGAMGFEKEVALKRIKSHIKLDERYLKALINEARLGGQVHHRNIVEVYEFDRAGDEYYLAMEYVRGWTLREIICDCRTAQQPIPPTVALRIGIEVCRGLGHAHSMTSRSGKSMHLVHRDLKPANVMLSTRGDVKIMDFGIAKADSNLFHTTATEITKGTPLYMSPEQVDATRRLTHQSDIFSLGSILYELVFLSPLFAGDHALEVLHRVIKADIQHAIHLARSHLPGLETILQRALAARPEDRYASAGEMATDLQQLLAQLGPKPTIDEWLPHYQQVRTGEFAVTDGPGGVGPDDPTEPFTDAGFSEQDPTRQFAPSAVDTHDLTRQYAATATIAEDDWTPPEPEPEPEPAARRDRPWLVPAVAGLMVLLVGAALLGTITVFYLLVLQETSPPTAEPSTPTLPVAADDDSGTGNEELDGSVEAETPTPVECEERTPATTKRPPPPEPPTPVTTGERSKLYVNSVPWSEVYLDGRLFERTPIMGREIAPGHHEVKLVCGVCATHQESTVAFDVAPGETYRNTSFRFQR